MHRIMDLVFTNVNTLIQARIDTAVGVLTSNHPDLIVKPIPSLFLGTINSSGGISSHSAIAFNPGAANMQSIGSKLYMPRQYAPSNNGVDIFEEKIKSILGNDVEFVDSWMYHVGFGNVHCGSTVKRTPILNWWTKQPAPQP